MPTKCVICSATERFVSKSLGVCVDCIRKDPEVSLRHALETHRRSRANYGLPSSPPRASDGIPCNICANECIIGVGQTGYCGLRTNVKGKLESRSTPSSGLLYAYEDPHVTNCCSAWFCPAGTGAGYPKYARTKWAERGYSNLAVFFYGCNFDCLFCQNYSHKNLVGAERMSDNDFAGVVARNRRLSCICFFGGSPEPQLPYALAVSRRVLEENRGRILRICFEWNGGGNKELVKRAADLSCASGGNMKFDLKCFEADLSMVLSGVDNRRSYENFAMVAREYYSGRSDLPVLTATTLLVPGYVDALEVEKIARFISDLDRGIPYSLLVFHPDYLMVDLPVTPRRQVEECYAAARKCLDRVKVGNLHLLA